MSDMVLLTRLPSLSVVTSAVDEAATVTVTTEAALLFADATAIGVAVVDVAIVGYCESIRKKQNNNNDDNDTVMVINSSWKSSHGGWGCSLPADCPQTPFRVTRRVTVPKGVPIQIIDGRELAQRG